MTDSLTSITSVITDFPSHMAKKLPTVVHPDHQLAALQAANAAMRNPAALYLASLGSVQSRRVMQSRLNRLAQLLRKETWQDIPWSDMDRAWLLLAKEAMSEQQCSPTTINATLSLLKGVALQAWELKLIDDNTYLRIKNTKSIRGRRIPKRRWLNKTDMLTLLDHCLQDDRLQGMRDASMLALLYGCGLRRSEVVGIDVEQLDNTERSIRILGKGNKERVVYPPARAWQMLTEWMDEGLAARSTGPLFCRIRKGSSPTQDRLTDQAVYFVIKQLIAKTGIKEFSPHDLRGSFISYLLDNGNDIKTVADIVGHADVRTTAGYDRRGEQRKKAVNRSIDL